MPKNRQEQLILNCSFCGKNQNDVFRLIAASPSVCICNNCIDSSANLVSLQTAVVATNDTEPLLRFADVAEYRKHGCSFCHKRPIDDTKLVIGHTSIVVCNECIEALVNLLVEEIQSSHKEHNE